MGAVTKIVLPMQVLDEIRSFETVFTETAETKFDNNYYDFGDINN